MHPRLPVLWSVTQVKFDADDIAISTVPTLRGADARLSALDALPRVTALDLSDNNVTDAELIHLEQFRTLTVLDLSGTKTTVEGRNRLRKVLSNCKIVPEH
jgi:Leucine-rich repeat (LRR) protein